MSRLSGPNDRPSPPRLVEEEFLLGVLADFLAGRPIRTVPADFKESRFFQIAQRQSVASIVAFFSRQTPDPFSPRLRQALEDALMSAIWTDELQRAEIESINEAFRKNGIRYLPLKGWVMKRLYPETFLREMHDYDVFVDNPSLSKVREIMTSLGYDYFDSCEHEDKFRKKPVMCVEVHHRLFSSTAFGGENSGSLLDWNRLLPVNEGTGNEGESEKSSEYRFTPEDFYQFMTHHLVKHWINDETTVRQYLDIAIYRRSLGATLDREKLDEVSRRSGTLDFIRNVERLTEVWFDGAESTPITDEMTRYVFHQHSLNAVVGGTQLLADSPNRRSGVRKRLDFLWKRFLTPGAMRQRGRDLPRGLRWSRPLVFLYDWTLQNVTRLFRRETYRKLFTILKTSDAQLESIQKFQERVGLSIDRLETEDWNDEK